MEDTGRLYATLFQVVRHPRQWLDVRHAQTLTWMMVGLIQAVVFRGRAVPLV